MVTLTGREGVKGNMIMSKGMDRIMTAQAERDRCGCPIVTGLTAHLYMCQPMIPCGCDVYTQPCHECVESGRRTDPHEPSYADWLDAPPGYEG